MNLMKLLPYLKYVPVIVMVAKTMADVVEASADSHSGAEKQAAALGAVKSALALGGLNVPDEVIIFVIQGVVSVNNALGKYQHKGVTA